MMRFKTGLVMSLLLVTVITAACAPSTDVEADAQAENVERLRAKLADAELDFIEQGKALYEANAEIERLTGAIEGREATEERQSAEITKALDALRAAKAAADAAAASKSSMRSLACSAIETEFPARIQADFRDWIVETQSESGEIPDDLEITIVEAAGQDGAWAFFAEFSTRLEPGVFSVDARSNFAILWGGMAPTESGIWEYLSETYPDGEGALAACLDLSFFVDT